jgi:hypothetical protein
MVAQEDSAPPLSPCYCLVVDPISNSHSYSKPIAQTNSAIQACPMGIGVWLPQSSVDSLAVCHNKWAHLLFPSHEHKKITLSTDVNGSKMIIPFHLFDLSEVAVETSRETATTSDMLRL